MNNEQILKLAIEKARDNGYRFSSFGELGTVKFLTEDYERPDVFTVIFSHDFAKSFWGESEVDNNAGGFYPVWQHHLQEMVISEDPLQYLSRFLDQDTQQKKI